MKKLAHANNLPGTLRQAGVALITALLMLALITISLASMAVHQQAAIHRAGNRQVQTQLVNLLGAGEKFAMAVLRRDRQEAERNNSDSTEDYWAESLPPVPVDGATVEGCIVDLQGKFNLNNLVNLEGEIEQLEYEQLRRLLTALNIDTAKAGAILDWIDRDIDATGTEGAEDDFYTGQTPAYRAANNYMVSPSELLLVRGFRVVDENGLDDYDTLLPHVTAIPTAGAVINVNTASSAVLASLADYMVEVADELKVVDDGYWENFPDCPEGGGLLDSLLEDDDDTAADPNQTDPNSDPDADPDAEEDGSGTAWTEIASFKASAKQDDEEKQIENANIDVSSAYFLARVTVTRDEAKITQYTVMERDNTGAIKIIQRTRNAY